MRISPRRHGWRPLTAAAVTTLAGGLLVGVTGPADAAPPPAPHRTAEAAAADAQTSPDLDVLFIGAHPDDEAFALSTYGQWNEDSDIKTGVITITRGEGGGNAVGPEEGPALGLIREAEERRAVDRAGITDVYDLDQVDFYYTVSAPLTQQVWGHDDTLERVVRVIRETRPEVIITMDPAPSPGNHGNHQYAGRMAFEGYHVASDPSVFPSQVSDEGLTAWSPSKLLLGSARGTAKPGPSCPTSFVPTRASQNIYGVWSGRQSQRYGKTWAQVEREAQREYASQGWAVFPDVSTDPNQLGCDFFTQVEARVPFVRGDQSAATADPLTALRGAVVRKAGDFPLGTGLEVDADPFTVTPGGTTTMSVTVTAPESVKLMQIQATPSLPSGWTATGNGTIKQLKTGESATRTFTVHAPDDATTNQRVLASVELTAKNGYRGHGDTELDVAPLVRGDQQLLPQVTDFQSWATDNGFPQMEGFVKPVLSLPSGGSRTVDVTLHNYGSSPQSGSVKPELPAGFSASPASASYAGLAPGADSTVTFTVTNTDASLPTSNQGGTAGDYDYAIVTTAGSATSTTKPALELVPTTTINEAPAAPALDGTVSAGEYAGNTIDLSRLWEGAPCTSAADCSATGHVTRFGNDLYVAVEVTDDVLGTKVDQSDCKRHWRTDSVELAIDPNGRSENTSTTFKTGIFPTTAQGGACFERDADSHQGPGAETAPGMQVVSTLSSPYTGYVIETKIPATVLPSTIDPQHLGFNAFVYDSDTQDKTGQTRIGWSTFGGVQGDPYRWGVATTPGWAPPSVPTKTPVIPTDGLLSVNSPQTIAQSVRNGVPIAGGPAAEAGTSAVATGAVQQGSSVRVQVDVDGPGEAHAFVVDPTGKILGSTVATLTPGTTSLDVAVSSAPPAGSRLLMAYAADAGGTTSSAAAVQ
jgi:LmbE family N-acetylglucosaminyl deacetylase